MDKCHIYSWLAYMWVELDIGRRRRLRLAGHSLRMRYVIEMNVEVQ